MKIYFFLNNLNNLTSVHRTSVIWAIKSFIIAAVDTYCIVFHLILNYLPNVDEDGDCSEAIASDVEGPVTRRKENSGLRKLKKQIGDSNKVLSVDIAPCCVKLF